MFTFPFPAICKTLAKAVSHVASASTELPAAGNSLRIVNDGAVVVFIALGPDGQLATLPSTTVPAFTCTPLAPNSTTILTIPSDSNYNISAICQTGVATLYMQVGEGS